MKISDDNINSDVYSEDTELDVYNTIKDKYTSDIVITERKSDHSSLDDGDWLGSVNGWSYY